jgi:NitT/TauT family transport system permease protein
MGPKWLFGLRASVPRPVALALGLAPIAALIGVWWLVTRGAPEERVIPLTILPSPLEFLERLRPLVETGLIGSTGVSLQRVAWGYLIAVAIALPLGILMGSLGSVRSLFSPLTTASGYIPIATLAPLTMMWFGIGEKQKISFLAIAFVIYLLPAVVASIDAVPDVYLRTAYTLGASRLQVILRVLVPVALPSIWAGMRVAFGVGWTYLVLAEVIGIDRGLGAMIHNQQGRGHHEDAYVIILVITLVAWISDLILNYIGLWLFPYRRRP